MRAPEENRAVLFEPPRAAAQELLAYNLELFGGDPADSVARLGERLGAPLAMLRDEARAHAWRIAREHVRRAHADRTPSDCLPQNRGANENEIDPLPAGPCIVSGHQPELFHPGVWAKNFALDGLARQWRGTGLNVLIDSDAVRSAALRVPGGSRTQPVVESVPFDAPSDPVAWEERRALDHDLAESFTDRAMSVLRPLAPQAMLPEFWNKVRNKLAIDDRWGWAFAAARHEIESAWGLSNLELPVGSLSQSPPFRRFTALLLMTGDDFTATYNRVLAEYRARYKVRNARHPAPDLERDATTWEMPLWVWSAERPRRARVFAERRGDRLVLTDRGPTRVEIPWVGNGDLAPAMESLAEIEACGIKLRWRALITTFALRLLLADLFLHGLGGAKYDRLTDQLFRETLGIDPPKFLTVTATLRLDVPRPVVGPHDLDRIAARLRDCAWHGETIGTGDDVVGESGTPAAIVRELTVAKRRWIAAQPRSSAEARERFLALRGVNAALAEAVAPSRRQTLRERDALLEDLRAARVLASREYAFPLHETKNLSGFLLEISRASP